MSIEITAQPKQEDEIDLMEVLRVLWMRKFWIAGFVVICSVAVLLYSLKMDNIYESRAVMRPANNNFGQNSQSMLNIGGLANLAGSNLGNNNVSPYNALEALIQDDSFLYKFVVENKFERNLIRDYDKQMKTPEFKSNKTFIVAKAARDCITFTEDTKTSFITLGIRNTDREFAKVFVDKLLIALSSKYRNIETHNIQEKIDNFKNEIDRTSDIALKNRLADLVANLIQNKVLAKAQEYYGFEILVMPAVSDQLNKVAPKRAVICMIAFILSFLAASMTALVVDKMSDARFVS